MKSKNYLSIYAKSFNWSGFFLPKKIYFRCSVLYDFCRTIDNIADQNVDLEIKKKELEEFKKKFEEKNKSDSVIKNMWDLMNERNISKKIVDDLFDGVSYDIKKEVIIKYGVWGKKSFLGKEFMGIVRTTFLINSKGKIHKIWNNVRVKDHAKEVFEEAKSLK